MLSHRDLLFSSVMWVQAIVYHHFGLQWQFSVFALHSTVKGRRIYCMPFINTIIDLHTHCPSGQHRFLSLQTYRDSFPLYHHLSSSVQFPDSVGLKQKCNVTACCQNITAYSILLHGIADACIITWVLYTSLAILCAFCNDASVVKWLMSIVQG